jgi:hypothetical protein
VAWADVQRPAAEAIPAVVSAHDDRLSTVA